MKSAFIRTLWGIYDHQGRKLYKRRTKIDNDILLVKQNKFQTPFRTYVFGEDNFKYLEDEGFDVKLVDKRPIVWDMDTQAFRHKLEAFKCGLEDYNEIVFLDWDCIQIKETPENFWETLRKKEKIQAILRMYKRKKLGWRTEDQRKIPCASFVYINGKQTSLDLIKAWEDIGCTWSEERAIAKYTDDLSGGWKNVDYYLSRFEPDFFVLMPEQGFIREKLTWKNVCFQHFNHHHVSSMLKKI